MFITNIFSFLTLYHLYYVLFKSNTICNTPTMLSISSYSNDHYIIYLIIFFILDILCNCYRIKFWCLSEPLSIFNSFLITIFKKRTLLRSLCADGPAATAAACRAAIRGFESLSALRKNESLVEMAYRNFCLFDSRLSSNICTDKISIHRGILAFQYNIDYNL